MSSNAGRGSAAPFGRRAARAFLTTRASGAGEPVAARNELLEEYVARSSGDE